MINDWTLRIIRKSDMIRRIDRHKLTYTSLISWFERDLQSIISTHMYFRLARKVEEYDAFIWYLEVLRDAQK